MIKKQHKKGAFFLKYFFIFSSIVLISVIMVGISLVAFLGNFITDEVLLKTKENAHHLSQTTTDIIMSGTISSNPEAAILLLCENVKNVASMSDATAFICDKDGKVIICPETIPDYHLKAQSVCEKHKNTTIPSSYVQKAKTGNVAELTTLGGTFDSLYSVAMEPFYIENNYIGFCVAASPIYGSITNGIKNVIAVFLISSAITIFLVTIAVYFMTGKIAKPIRNLETATTLYSSGDFSYKVPEIKAKDELATLITNFNAMATSLDQIENSRRSFIANVSHEFKTPMTTIGGFINGILDGTIPPEKQDYYLQIVASEINRLSKMVNVMLNISKIETGNVQLNIEKFDLSQKIVPVFLGFEQLIFDKNIEIEGLDDLQSAPIHGDAAMIEQVIYNLVDNAVKFTDTNGKISVQCSDDGNSAYLSVTNTGKGIPTKDLPKVFDRFYKVDQSRSTDVKSTGLGLYLIKSIVNLHNGTVSVESEVDKFTKFTVKFPK